MAVDRQATNVRNIELDIMMRNSSEILPKHLLLLGGAFLLVTAVMTSPLLADAPDAVVKSANVIAKVELASAQAVPGHKLGIIVDFSVAPGWHIYGEPLPPDYTVTKVTFDKDLVQQQSLNFPKPTPLNFAALDQTFPVYQGNFEVTGNLIMKPSVSPGDHNLTGTVDFQECNNLECKMPQSLHFAIPVKVQAP